MNKLLKLFPVFAMVLGFSLAFANAPTAVPLANAKKAFISGSWQTIPSNFQQGVNYDCLTSQAQCTKLVDSMGNDIPGSEEVGTYRAR